MKTGYRVFDKNQVGTLPADLIQISYWKTFGPDMDEIREMASRCREFGLGFVIHPVFTALSETRPGFRERNTEELVTLARMADLGLIVHDETLPGGGRLSGIWLEQYQENLESLLSICPVSVENANNTPDIDWFWKTIGGSITLDIGHFEASGLDSVQKVKSLPEQILNRVEYVHMHRKHLERGGLVDHWPLTADCPEVKALEELAIRKKNISVILEINEMDCLGDSLDILKKIAGSVG